jgi:hypothetical protein
MVKPSTISARTGLALEIFDGAFDAPRHAANMTETGQGDRPLIAS